MSTRFALAALVMLAGCDSGREPPPSQGATTPSIERESAESSALRPAEVPVRIGELGPNFPACYAMARFRDRVVGQGEPIAVRAAPFEHGSQTARIAADGQFFICTRSHDQRWFAIVWDDAEGASRRCGVSRPVASRRDYNGPCQSGWIPSALVRLESGILHNDAPVSNSTN